ncbi:MAG: hypothetical protein DWI48_05110 [Chloroflexi bacterium]|nr:MAG: hypothetical protein DWI48_05110 [Chloroflexota bacterium]
MSYGYDPKNRVKEGSWQETWIFVQAALEVIGPLLAVFMAIIIAIVISLGLLLIDIRLMVIPGSVVAAGLFWVWRREKRQHAADEAALRD